MLNRYVPENSTARNFDDLNAVVYIREHNGLPCATAYQGKRKKPDFRYRFKNTDQMEKHISEWVENIAQAKARREAKNAERLAFKHDLKEGDILYSSWGYEQTNIDFYQVTKVVSEKTVIIREINGKDVGNNQGHFMSATKVAVKDSFRSGSKEMLKRVQSSGGRPYIRLNSYSWTTPWDGTPMNYSWYA